MKVSTQAVVTVLTFSAGLSALGMAAHPANPLVNAYGEPAGLGNMPTMIIPNAGEQPMRRSNGMSIVGGYVDARNFESSGSWKARTLAEARGTVIIGPLEVIDSGPTGPMDIATLSAAETEITSQVLTRIAATDKVMAALTNDSKALDASTRAQFDTAASDVRDRRSALREDLKTVRAADDDQWSNARSNVAVSFNAYVQSMHRAEAIVAAGRNT